MSNPLDREQFLAGFLAEADDHLRSSSANLLAVEAALRAGAPHARPVRELFRSLHTLKGLSAMVGIEPIVEIAHQMESILRSADRSGLALSPESVAVLLKGIAAIEVRIRAVSDRKPVPAPPEGLLAALASLQADAAGTRAVAATGELVLEADLLAKLSAVEADQLVQGARAGRRAVRVDFVPSAARAEQGVSITQARERVSRIGEIVKVVPRTQPGAGLYFTLLVLTEATDEALADAAFAEAGRVATVSVAAKAPRVEESTDDDFQGRSVRHGVVRVEVARLDDALEKLSALVVTRFRFVRSLGELREKGADVRELGVVLQEMTRQLRDLRSSIMRARMVSVSELLERVPLIVRGLTQVTGREIKLEIDAGKAELDKAVAERVFPAIIHLVRNAVDHAIEPPDERARAGKTRVGTVRVACFEHSDSQLELVVSDDGRGVDREAVARKAGKPLPATDAELLDLITLPGLSTRESADKTSGRGMGLDIVKRTVETLGGDMHLETKLGAGTRFTLRIPLSVSILDAFSFECAGQTFVVPMAMIDEIVELDAAKLFDSPSPGGDGSVRLLERRGRVMPLFSLAALLDAGTATSARKALIVRRGGEPFAFAVDRMLGQQEVVIRPVNDPLVKVAAVSGTTDLGDGRPTLVLDLLALTGAVSARREVLV